MLHNPGAEAERWARSGEINVERAQWVAKGLRTVPRAERQALAESLLLVQWNTPALKQ